MFWSIIEGNKKKTILLIVLMGFFLIMTGSLIGMSLVDGNHPSAGITGALVATGIWVAMLLMSLYASDTVFLEISRAGEVSKESYPQLFNVVEEMVIAGSLHAMPRIFLVPDPSPNAFALGKSPDRSCLCITAGLLAMCTRDELQGVVAHEIGHIMNRDVLYMTVASSLLGSVLLLSDFFLRSFRYTAIRFATRSRKAIQVTGLLILLSLLLSVVGPVLVRILYYSISRRREYLADATSARLTRYPEGLASALEKIGKYPGATRAAPAAISPFYIVNTGKQGLEDGAFATHPPLAARIRILRAMTQGAGYREYLKSYLHETHARAALIPQEDLKDVDMVDIRTPSADEQAAAGLATEEVRRRAGEIIRAMNDFIFISCPCGMKLKFPPEFAGKQVPCPRCKRMHSVQKADVKTLSAFIHSNTPPGSGTAGIGKAQDVQYQPGTWQTITCAVCGRAHEISPRFGGSRLTCSGCGSVIRIASASPAHSQA